MNDYHALLGRAQSLMGATTQCTVSRAENGYTVVVTPHYDPLEVQSRLASGEEISGLYAPRTYVAETVEQVTAIVEKILGKDNS